MILITGAARSGTSLIAGIIDICGGQGGKVVGPGVGNTKGFFENKEIRNGIIKPYLRSIGADPKGQDPLPDFTNLKPLPDLRIRVKRILGNLPEAYYKGAKICLLWPLWFQAFPDATYIIVRRPDEQILDSCNRTHFMNRRRDWKDWLDHHKVCFDYMQSIMPARVITVWSNEVVDGNLEVIRIIVNNLWLEWNEYKVRSFIDKGIYHQ